MAIKDHSNRRKSIAVPSHGRNSLAPRHRRRAHSGMPSELSPLARSRLSGPFKGILKSSLKPARVEDTLPNAPSSSQEPTESQSQTSTIDFDVDATQSMELTQDFKAKIHDNFARKSMGRRVSFSEHAFVRVFEKSDHTNSTGSPQSSPAASDPSAEPVVSDENQYSRAALAQRRRSSGRQSLASDMDLTSIGGNSHTLLNESFDDDMAMSDDMEMTGALDQNNRRRRSLPAPAFTGIGDDSISFSEDMSESTDGDTHPMEFTIPLSQALRPAQEDPLWLELQRTTHAGPSLLSDDDMEDDVGDQEPPQRDPVNDQSSMDRRMSLGFGLTNDESFSSMEESFDEALDGNDRTLNLTAVLGRASLGVGRLSEGQESAMDESETYGHVLPVASTPVYPSHLLQEKHSAPASVAAPIPAPAPVFHPPSAIVPQKEVKAREPPAATSSVFSKPKPAVFTPKHSVPKSTLPTLAPRSPPKPVTKAPHNPPPKQFSAAFAPPVTRPSPKKPPGTLTPKRPLPQDENAGNGPNPSKRPNLGKEKEVSTHHEPDHPSSAVASRPLSPSKKAPFESSTNTRQSNIRRPSGYFARRRSMAPSLTNNEVVADEATTNTPSPKKKTVGRASMASGDADAWKRFDQDPQHTSARTVEEPVRPPTVTLSSESPIPNATTSFTSSVPDEGPAGPSNPTPGPAPADSFAPMNMEVEPTEPAQQDVQQEEPEEEEEDEMPAISIEQFFDITGIKFMDDLQAPRRSMHPSHSRQPRSSSDISLADYAIALAIDIPQLALYSRVSSDLQAWMQQSRVIFAEAEDEAAKMTPELFVEYSRADEEGQAELLHQLNLIRTNTRGLAKADWYEWKLQWIDGLRATAEQALSELQSDVKSLEDLCSKGEDVIPALQAEYDSIMRELEADRAEVAEIEQCDQEYLSELKAGIAEQDVVLESTRNEVKEESDQLSWLGERLAEIELDKAKAKDAITKANRIVQMQSSSTEAEVFRLRDELAALESIHMFHITKLGPQEFEYVHASQFHVRIPCVDFTPVAAKIQITPTVSIRNRQKDDFPLLSQLFLACANKLAQQNTGGTIRDIVQMLRDYWSSCAQLRLQFKHLSIGFPVEIIPSRSEDSSFSAAVSMMLPEKKAKAVVSFNFDCDTFSRWPCSLRSLRYDVDVAYGDLDRTYLSDVISQILSSKSAAENYACLADACTEAQKAQ